MEEDCEYPDSDCPWTMYFNGQPMPRWANSWHLLEILQQAEEFMRGWDEAVDFKRFWHLHCRIDHVGVVESEEPEAFRVCCLTVIFLMLREKETIFHQLNLRADELGASTSEIVDGLRDGLFAMYHLSLADGIAFWTSGYDADRERLCEAIRCHRLPRDHPDWLEAPHVSKNRSEALLRMKFMRRDINSLLGARPISKDIRRLIHELPTER